MSIETKIIADLNKSISSKTVPASLIDTLFQYFITNPSSFSNFLLLILSQSLPKYKKSKKVSILFQILKNLFSRLKSSMASSKLLETLLNFIIGSLDTKDQYPRQGYSIILSYLLPLDQWNCDICIKLQNKLREKTFKLLQDRCPAIRNLAINLASKLSMDKEMLTTTFNDPSKVTRIKSLLNVYCDSFNIEVFSENLDHIDEEVRFVAIIKVLEYGLDKLPSKLFKKIIIRCWEERSKKVKFQMKNALNNFIVSKGLVKFLEKLDIFTFTIKEQSLIIDHIQEYLSECRKSDLYEAVKDTYLTYIATKSEQIEEILSSVLCIEALHNQDPDALNNLLSPTLIFDLLTYTHPILPQFFTYSMIRLSLCMDIGDEKIRSQLVSFLINICKTLPLCLNIKNNAKNIEENYLKLQFDKHFFISQADLLRFIVKVIKSLVQQYRNEFSNMMSEVLSEIREPLEGNSDKKSLVVQKDVLMIKVQMLDDEILALDSECRGSQRFLIEAKIEIEKKNEEACRIEEEIEEINKEIVERLYRSCVIVTEMLREVKHGVLNLDLADFVNNLVLASLDKDEEVLQIVAYECLTQCILHSQSLLHTYEYLYRLVLRQQDTYVEYISIISLFDIYMVHKPDKTLSLDSSLNESLLGTLLNYQKNPNPFIQAVTIEGFCKLIINNHIDSALILTKLIFSYIDIHQVPCIKQSLQLFFNNLDITIEKHPDTVLNSLKVFLSIFCENISKNQEIKSIDLSILDLKKLFDFIWSKFKAQYQGISYESNLLYFYFSQISARPSSTESLIYSKLACRVNFASLCEGEIGFINSALKKLLNITQNESLLYVQKRLSEFSSEVYNKNSFKSSQKLLQAEYLNTLELIKAFKKMFLSSSEGRSDNKNLKKFPNASQTRVKLPIKLK